MKMQNLNLKQIYVNKKQVAFLKSDAKFKIFYAGRGGAKSFTIGLQTALRVISMPKAVFGLFGPTFQMLKNNTLPSVLSALREMGFVEQKSNNIGHFVCFRKPPEHWDQPFHEIKDFTNVISFCNGFAVQLISWHDASLVRGKSLDGCDVDEACLLDHDTWSKEFFPTIRGNRFRFLGNKFHQQICLYSSPNWLSSGAWVSDYEKINDKNVFFLRSSSWDNVHILGKETLKTWQRDLPELVYRVEILGESVDTVPNCFYNEFEEKKHSYIPNLHTPLSDIDLNAPIYVSFDFNARFLSCIVAQVFDGEIRILREIFIKGVSVIENLVDLICTEFAFMSNKNVKIYGDRGGYESQNYVSSKNAIGKEAVFESIIRQFSDNAWSPNLEAQIYYSNHQERYEVINQAFSEKEIHLPKIRINKRGCINLCIALRKTSVLGDYQKDKRSENDGFTPPEQSVHLTDCVDYVIFPIIKNNVGKKFKASAGMLFG